MLPERKRVGRVGWYWSWVRCQILEWDDGMGWNGVLDEKVSGL